MLEIDEPSAGGETHRSQFEAAESVVELMTDGGLRSAEFVTEVEPTDELFARPKTSQDGTSFELMSQLKSRWHRDLIAEGDWAIVKNADGVEQSQNTFDILRQALAELRLKADASGIPIKRTGFLAQIWCAA